MRNGKNKKHVSDHLDQVALFGRVSKIFYANNNFTVGKLTETGTCQEVIFTAHFDVALESSVNFIGKYVTHPKYGYQFSADYIDVDIPMDASGIINYISNHPDMGGIGPSRAMKIMAACGNDGEIFLKKIKDSPEFIAENAKIPIDVILNLQQVWMSTYFENAIRSWLSSFGLSHHEVASVIDVMRDKKKSLSIADIKKNPYLMIGVTKGMGFKRIDIIARKMGTLKTHYGRIESGIIYLVKEEIGSGHCWIEYQNLIENANKLLAMDCLDAEDRIQEALDSLIERKMLISIPYDGRSLISTQSMYEMEQYIIDILDEYGVNGNSDSVDRHGIGNIESKISGMPNRPSDTQLQAIRNAIYHTISVITGGAGTGKSFIVSAIQKIFEGSGATVKMCAPTGKASKRLQELSKVECKTIHRMLGYNEFENGETNPFTYNENHKLNASIIIVDEFSMVDISLAFYLFSAVDFARTSLVLVGDHNQLPAIGAGNLLRDMIKCEKVKATTLDTVFRQAGVLKENSSAILKGKVNKTSELSERINKYALLDNPATYRQWYKYEQFSDPMYAQGFIRELFEKRLGAMGYDVTEDVQVLTPMKKGPLGTKELNILLQRLIQRERFDVTVNDPDRFGNTPLYEHDKVIQTRNNYKIDVMNGTIGYVVYADRVNDQYDVDFDGVVVHYGKRPDPEYDAFCEEHNSCPDYIEPVESLKDVCLSYALTIHKSQGSEFPCVIVIIHKSHSFMHNRNLFYTGVTRAKETAIVIGDKWGISNCATKIQAINRRTFMSRLF